MENMNTWRLSLFIDNSCEIYCIISMAAKMVKEYDGVTVSTKERKEAALKHAEYIIDCAEYKANEK